MGKEGQQVPEMTDDFVQLVSDRYIELYEKITGKPFVKQHVSDDQVVSAINASLQKLLS
jgi:phosphoribosylaminoimidazole-succinocarboxamide synthase